MKTKWSTLGEPTNRGRGEEKLRIAGGGSHARQQRQWYSCPSMSGGQGPHHGSLRPRHDLGHCQGRTSHRVRSRGERQEQGGIDLIRLDHSEVALEAGLQETRTRFGNDHGLKILGQDN